MESRAKQFSWAPKRKPEARTAGAQEWRNVRSGLRDVFRRRVEARVVARSGVPPAKAVLLGEIERLRDWLGELARADEARGRDEARAALRGKFVPAIPDRPRSGA